MTTWHAPPDALERYATGDIDAVTACSIDAHLEHCAACREALAATADPLLLEAMWEGVIERVDQGHPAVVERVLRRIGLDEGTARLVAATPALRLAWMAAVAVIVGIVVLACGQADSDAPFLVLAPLLPLIGVAAAFAAADPAGEIGMATPLFGLGLVLRRSEVVLVTSFGILLVGALALPGFETRDAGWVLPALAMSFSTIALAGRFPVVPTATVLGGGWIAAVTGLSFLDGYGSGLADTVAFAAVGQLMFGLASAVALSAVLFRSHLDLVAPGV